MKSTFAAFAVLMIAAQAIAQEVPRPSSPHNTAVVGGGSQGGGTTPLPPRPNPRPDVPQPPSRPEPRPRPQPQDQCEVIMVDGYNRVIYRYVGLPDIPSNYCSGPMQRCQDDVVNERVYRGRCYQTVL